MTAPTRTSLDLIADHRHVTVDARICAIERKHEGTRRPWAVLTVTDGTTLVEVNVYPLTYALTAEHLEVGNLVSVSGEVGVDADGVFLAAHAIHPAGVSA